MINSPLVKNLLTYLSSLPLITCILAYPQIISAQDSDLKFNHITTRDGLSQNTVSCILQDSKGFMWFGTQDGLNKYDETPSPIIIIIRTIQAVYWAPLFSVLQMMLMEIYGLALRED